MISVIVPAYNEAENIANCLESLNHQTFPREQYEIIVVDDGSPDQTANVAQSFPGIRLISQKNQGPAAARNHGVQQARGEIVLFTDADCIPLPDWISEMVQPLRQNPEIVAVKGAYETRQRSWTARFVQLEFEDKYDKLEKQEFIDFIDTYAAAYRREIFLQAGGFSLDFRLPSAEDAELGFRLADKGYKMVFNPKARVIHQHPESPLIYLKKKYFFAYWRLFATLKNPKKIMGDSYTPQLMKLQLLLFPLLLLEIALFFVGLITMRPMLWLFGLYFGTMIPFLVKSFRRDPEILIRAPFFLVLRSAGQFFGLVRCLWDYYKKRNDGKKGF
jgi:cellulose synthase/poly-beta-1,6-N-acetylglucosamine synthase-like glycosyltransferase